MRHPLPLLLFVLLLKIGFAQSETQHIDSLQEVVSKQQGREKVLSMIELSKAFYDFSFDDCIATGEAAISEAKALNDTNLIMQANWKLGVRYMYHNDLDLAHEYLSDAKRLLGSDGDAETLMFILNSLGRIEMFTGEIDSSLATYQQALAVSEALGNESNCADVTNNLACLYIEQGNIDKAHDNFEVAKRWFERLGDTLSVAQCDNNLGLIHLHRQQYDQAKDIFMHCIPVFEQYDDTYSLAETYQNLGVMYAEGLCDIDSAIICLSHSIQYATLLGDKRLLTDNENYLKEMLHHTNQLMTQNEQLDLLMKRYRLAFFGVLGLAFVAIFAIILYKPKR